PTVAYGLMLIGIWGLLLEGYNPGAVLPGVAGSVCLLIALFAFQILSVNYAGLALVVLGTAMIISEFFFPTYGSLGVGGLIAFVVGSLILFDTDVPGMNVGRPLIGAFATVGGLVIAGIVYLASRSMRRPVAIAILIIVLVFSAINVLNEYERVVVFTLGRFTGIKGPGLVLVWPGIQRTRRVDLRVIVLNVPKQDVITRDNVSVKVNAVVYFRVVDAGKAIIQVANAFDATSQVAQTTLRSVVGQHEMDDLLAQRDKLNVDLQ